MNRRVHAYMRHGGEEAYTWSVRRFGVKARGFLWYEESAASCNRIYRWSVSRSLWQRVSLRDSYD
jgi:hypothetical protein